MVRWNGVDTDSPWLKPPRTAWDDLNADLEHISLWAAVLCTIFGAVCGRLAAPALGY